MYTASGLDIREVLFRDRGVERFRVSCGGFLKRLLILLILVEIEGLIVRIEGVLVGVLVCT